MRTGNKLSFSAIAWLFLLAANAGAIPVTVDSVTTGVGDLSSFTISHPVDASNCLLLVAVHYVEDRDSSGSVTYAGLPLTRVGAITYESTKPRVELWKLFNPPVDTASVVVAVADGSSAKAAVTAVTFRGADPAKPIDTCITKAAKSTSGSIVISSEQADLVLGAVTSLANGEPDPSLGSTEIWSQEVDAGHFGQGTTKPGANSVNIGWAYPESKEWATLAVNINHKNFAPVIGSLGSFTIREGDTLHLTITAVDEDGTIPALSASGLPADAKFKDNGDGTGTFSFISDQTSEGTYTLLFVASDGLLADSESVSLTVNPANVPPVLAAIGPQSVALGSTLTLSVTATDADSTAPAILITPALANATLTDHGDGTAGYSFTPVLAQVGTQSVTFIATDGVFADSELVEIAVLDTTTLAYIRIETEDGSAISDTSLSADDSLILFCRGYMADSTLLGNVAVNWSILGSDSVASCASTVQPSAVVDLRHLGTVRVMVSYTARFADTTGLVSCTPGLPSRLEISPDSRRINLDDSIQFSAVAYDADSNLTAPGQLTWSVLGHVGQIDPLGLFVSTAPGAGWIEAVTDDGTVADTTGLISVQSVLLSPLALGSAPIHAGDRNSVQLAFALDNYFETSKTITSLTVRNLSRGAGTFAQVAGNLDSIALYLDRDLSYDISAWDTLIASMPSGPDSTFVSPCSLVIDRGGREVILLAAAVGSHPRDADTIDFGLIPSTDVAMLDSTVADGPATVNSFGFGVIDGMTADQIAVGSTGIDTIPAADTLYLCSSFDIPRNGYAADILNAIEIVNEGTASIDAIDSMLLFVDDGDGAWNGRSDEIFLGALTFIGGSWSRSGLTLPLTNPATRLFIAARLTRFPTDGATISLMLPANGVRVQSGNDGPNDRRVYSLDTLVIQGREYIAAATIQIPARSCLPGAHTGPLSAVELTNGYALPVALDTVRFSFTGVDPLGASPSQLYSQIDSVYLYVEKDNAIGTISSSDSLIAVGTLSGGAAVFNTGGLSIDGVGGRRTLVLDAKLNLLTPRNGNTVAFTVTDSAAITCDRPVRYTGSFPLVNAAPFTINAFPASAVTVQSLPAANLYAGQTDRLVFAFGLPRNGYAGDKLSSIDLTNRGSLSSATLLRNVRLWLDVTGDGFTADDQLQGEFTYTGTLWRLTNLRTALNLPATPFLVTVSVSDGLFDGGTLQFRIPVAGLQYASGTIGPDDASITSPTSFLVFPSNRVTAVSIPGTPGVVHPGSSANLLMSFALYNGYVGQIRTLSQITFTNTSFTSGTLAYSDHELGQVSVYRDTDKNRVFDNDSLIGTGMFTQGLMRLDGLSAALAPESLAYFFVVADVPADLIDGDSVSIAVANATDFAFKETAVLNGDLPLTGGSKMAVDGSVLRQYRTFGPDGRSLTPGDTNVVMMTFSPAANGSKTDFLQAVTVRNAGTADSASITALKLWHDVDGDGTLSTGDTVLSAMNYSASGWSATDLALPISPAPPVLMLAGNVGVNAVAGATVRLEIPVSGCSYQSANDGPLDSALVAPGSFTISTSGLRVAFSSMRAAYSIGQIVHAAMTATNVSAGTMDSVVGEIDSIINPIRLRLDSSAAGPVTLVAGQSFTSHFYFTAVELGSAAVRTRARSGNPIDSSAIIQTPAIYVQQAISPVALRIRSTGPTAVTRGQTNVFPLILECAHPNTSSGVAAMSLAGIRLRVTNGSDTAITANSVFDRLSIATGFEVLSVLQNVPADSLVDLSFVHPLVIPPGGSQSLMLIADIDAATSAPRFMIQIDSATWIPLLDNNTGQTLAHASSTIFPIRTVTTRIDIPSQQIAISAESCERSTVNFGQADADILKLSLRHTGLSGSSAVQLTGLSLRVEDSTGAAVPAADLFSRISLHRQAYFIGEAIPIPNDTLPTVIHLSTPVTLNAQEIDSIYVAVSVESSPGHPGFRLVISDSSSLEVRDLNTGTALHAVSDTALVTGGAFPIRSVWTSFRMPAEPVVICPTDITPGSVSGGADAVPVISLSVQYPVSAMYSSVRLNQARIRIVDGSGAPINTDQLFSRMGFAIGSGSLQYCEHLSVGSGYTDFQFGVSGITVAPGDSFAVRIVGDLNPEAAATEFALRLDDIQKITTADASDSRLSPGAALAQGCSATWPFSTALTSILLPAGRPFATRRALPVQMAPAGSRRVVLFDGALDYSSASPLGRIDLRNMTVALSRRVREGASAQPVNQSVAALYLEVNGIEVGSDTLLTQDTIRLDALTPVTIGRGDNIPLRLTCDLLPSALPGNITATFCDSSFLGVVDKSLSTPVYPIFSGLTYPIKAGELSVVAASLESSFSNYPNPFNPSRGNITTIGFVLTEDATVDIDVFTLTGESVYQVVGQSHRGAGAYQTDSWAGINGDGRVVQPGVYYCRITATYDSGRVDTFRRKIAIVR